ncbi:MAG: phosphoribosylglycinamide formyltransferase [Legionellales bacterium]|nr:phosphoribosylglycinamide formyltransferase [Legionellales bacterium]
MKKIGILVSGKGSNMTAIIDACHSGYLLAEVKIVISSNPSAKALEIANEKNIKTIHFNSFPSQNINEIDVSICKVLHDNKVDIVLLAGFMKKVGPVVLEKFEGRILNVHPSLLPKHGGKGLYGMNVHREVISAGDKESGATIHLVNNEYDEGAILAQKSVIVGSKETAESLASKVLEIEHRLYVDTVKKIIEGSISI